MLGRIILACATFVVATVAQSRIAFTVLPTNIVAGQPVTIQWGGGDNSPVTLILQQGSVNNLQTVELITGSATGTSYTWTPETSLPNADNYALKIVQGDQPPNYTGMIALTGGSTSGPTNAISALASSTGSSSASVPTNPASGGVVGGGSNSSNATTTMAMGTGVVGSGASGSAATGTAMSRNTTMSMATLSSSASMASKVSASSASAASATATSSSGSGLGSGSSTSSGTSPSSSSKSGAVSVAASNFALLCAAVVGVAYLG
ncbi:hypothetical protein N7G274_010405 [Stereocaulon virgatum]|uniref:Yeast cell wall synthesis Kre9/Knh1-like N-terminal domain-containing protein n=1 Tax=Stereocaulon virgatum TaxID=373712 RepID=A0ABR3ZTM3_9LECA